jgi:hypothetical protein
VPITRRRLASLSLVFAALLAGPASRALARTSTHQTRPHHTRAKCPAGTHRVHRHGRVKCVSSKSSAKSKASAPAAAVAPLTSSSSANHIHPIRAPQRVVEEAPTSTVAPAIDGSAVQGQQLSAEAGTWAGATPIAYAYQWRRNGGDIAGATGPSYVLTVSDVGEEIDVVVTATNAAGSSTAASPPTAAVAPLPVPVEAHSAVNSAPTGPGAPAGGWHVAFADGFGAPLGTAAGQDNFFYPNENNCCNASENHHGDNTNELEAYNGSQDHITPEGLELVNAFHPNAMPAEGSYPVRNYLSGAATTRPQYATGGWHPFTWEPGGGETWAFECNCKLPSNYPKYSGTDPGWWSTDQTWTNEFDFFESWGWGCNPLATCGFGVAWVYNTSPVHTEESALYGMITKLEDPALAFHRYTTVVYPNNTWSEYIDGQLQTWVGSNGVAPAPPEFKRVKMALLLTNAIRYSSVTKSPNPYPEFSTPGETRSFDVRSIAVYQDAAHAGANVTGGGVAPGTTLK